MVNLYFGDCLEIMDDLILEGKIFDAIITDPPYGTTRNRWDIIIPFGEMWKRLNKLIKPNGVIILFSDGLFTSKLKLSNEKMWRYDRVWDKQLVSGHLNANRMPLRQTETISVFYAKQPVYNPQKVKGQMTHSRGKPKEYEDCNYGEYFHRGEISNMKHPTSLISIQKPHPSKSIHPTEKPIKLMEELVKTYTKTGDNVLDFTCGAGATLLACEKLGRHSTGIDNGVSEKKGKYLGWRWIDVVSDRCGAIKSSYINR